MHDEGRVDSYSVMLEGRVERWLLTDEARAMACAHLYRHLPELFRLLAHAALDARLPERDRSAVLAALKYVVAPFDLVPEGVLGTSGLRDDLVLAAFVVERMLAGPGRDVVREHWPAASDPEAIARAVLDASGALVDPEVCERLREWAV